MSSVGSLASDLLGTVLLGPIWVFLCVLSRLGPIMAMMPPVQGTLVPNRIKVLLAIMVSASIAPLIDLMNVELPSHLLDAVIALAKELLLGLMYGTSVMMVITCLQVGSQIVGSLSSMEFATAADPSTQESVSVISQMMSLMAMALFVALGGHRIMIGACLDSFLYYPAGGVLTERDWLSHVHELVGHSLSIGIRASAPAAIALLLANFVTALIARTLPQLNILVVGFNINVTVMLIVLGLTMSSAGWVFQNELVDWVNRTLAVVPKTVLIQRDATREPGDG
jgi:flagellar biosynthetic protein FliR